MAGRLRKEEFCGNRGVAKCPLLATLPLASQAVGCILWMRDRWGWDGMGFGWDQASVGGRRAASKQETK